MSINSLITCTWFFFKVNEGEETDGEQTVEWRKEGRGGELRRNLVAPPVHLRV